MSATTKEHIFEYFVVVRHGDPDIQGEDDPLVTYRYPSHDRESTALPCDVAWMCLPTGHEAYIQAFEFYVNVATAGDGSKLYLGCLYIPEKHDSGTSIPQKDRHTRSRSRGASIAPRTTESGRITRTLSSSSSRSGSLIPSHIVGSSRDSVISSARRPSLATTRDTEEYVTLKHGSVICLLSKFPVYTVMHQCLFFLANRFWVNNTVPKLAHKHATLREHVRILCQELVFSQTASWQKILLPSWNIVHVPPRDIAISSSTKNATFAALFSSLEARTILMALCALLSEQPVRFVSASLWRLSSACEAIQLLLAPLSWENVCIPILPVSAAEVLDAPVPMLLGVHVSVGDATDTASMFEDDDHSNDPLVISLDTGQILSGINAPLLQQMQREYDDASEGLIGSHGSFRHLVNIWVATCPSPHRLRVLSSAHALDSLLLPQMHTSPYGRLHPDNPLETIVMLHQNGDTNTDWYSSNLFDAIAARGMGRDYKVCQGLPSQCLIDITHAYLHEHKVSASYNIEFSILLAEMEWTWVTRICEKTAHWIQLRIAEALLRNNHHSTNSISSYTYDDTPNHKTGDDAIAWSLQSTQMLSRHTQTLADDKTNISQHSNAVETMDIVTIRREIEPQNTGMSVSTTDLRRCRSWPSLRSTTDSRHSNKVSDDVLSSLRHTLEQQTVLLDTLAKQTKAAQLMNKRYETLSVDLDTYKNENTLQKAQISKLESQLRTAAGRIWELQEALDQDDPEENPDVRIAKLQTALQWKYSSGTTARTFNVPSTLDTPKQIKNFLQQFHDILCQYEIVLSKHLDRIIQFEKKELFSDNEISTKKLLQNDLNRVRKLFSTWTGQTIGTNETPSNLARAAPFVRETKQQLSYLLERLDDPMFSNE